jgi:hypothetical protein
LEVSNYIKEIAAISLVLIFGIFIALPIIFTGRKDNQKEEK